MTEFYLIAGLAELALVSVLLIRLWRGPSVSDRVVALNTSSVQVALAVLFFAAYAQRSPYIDVAMWFASFSYLGGLVWSRYLERGLL